ncbi:mucoidy inhibitor MuiA family protein [Capnocytophaga sp.]|uniref:mucoidy inhibitor MuiA family protein n=1 Tax=Capnocytophaga sp. TaxID=44737 RepID=UPI0026DC71AB|nr:mucoidy inhibitor MuiA family protein [Capnocytophaga sp.]MDO5106318.1 mucoidy inhibitor MuiA family protein [Capnocytophaga sp.]
MKPLFYCILGLFPFFLNAQDSKEIKTKVSEVTVFTSSAQVVRKKQVEIPKGVTELKFSNLSPFINPESIRIKATSGVTILSVSHQINFLDKLKPSPEVETLTKTLETLENQIQTERTHLTIIKDNIDLLQKNKDLSGKNNPISAANLQQVMDFYNQRITDLKFKENQRNDRLAELLKKQRELENQKKTVVGKLNNETGEVRVKISSERATSVPLELSYVVENASWTPSYDLRATDISQPITLIYKANVTQDTKEDWENVKLTLSSADPYVTSEAPELKTYFLGYNTRPPSYQKSQYGRRVNGQIQGIVIDESGVPVPGATVLVKGSTIGASTDFDGKFSLDGNLVGNNLLEISSIGFNTQTLAPKPVMTVRLLEDTEQLEEVVVTGYGGKRKKAFAGSTEKIAKKEEVQQDYIALETNNTPTNIQFEIKVPYTIKPDNQNYAVETQSIRLSTDYQYHAIPKVEPVAFLLGYVTDWEKHNLLEGEASIFFEETYVGKTLLKPSQTSDTLKIALGQDKKVSVQREKIKDFSSRQFIGGKKEVSKLWKTTLRNHKKQPIKIVVYDQIPVSTSKDIEVITKNNSGGKIHKETGKIEWNFTIQPSQKQEFELEYSVKYPKDRTLYIE